MAKRLREENDSGLDGDLDDQGYAQSPAKWFHLDDDSEPEGLAGGSPNGEKQQTASIGCILPPHKAPAHFNNDEEYQIHMEKFHNNRCHECNRNLPSQHYLNLHLSEHHDPFTAIRRDKGENTYACLVEGCERLCSSPPRRRLHCIAKHHFPANYNFGIIDYGIAPDKEKITDEFCSTKRPLRQGEGQKKMAPPDTGSMDYETPQPDRNSRGGKTMMENPPLVSGASAPVEEVASSLAALSFQPRSLKFGRKRTSGLERRGLNG